MAKQAKLELQAKRSRTSIRATWKRVGTQWRVVGKRKQKFRGNFVASGKLVRSIRPAARDLSIGISAEWYADAIIEGRKPWRGAGFKGRKGIPVETMKTWTRQKRMRPRDPASNMFIKNTPQNRRAQQFLINRKIKHFGTEPFDFVSIAFSSTMAMHEQKIQDAITQDLDNAINS